MRIGIALVLLAFLALLPIPVRAQSGAAQQCHNYGNFMQCDEGTAFAECQAFMAATRIKYPAGAYRACEPGNIGPTPGYWGAVKTYPAGSFGVFEGATAIFYAYAPNKTCAKREEEVAWSGPGIGGMGAVCSNGCVYEGSAYAGSPVGRLFAANGQTCTESDHPKPTTPDPGEGDGGGDGGGTDPGGGDGGGTDPGGGDGGGTDPGGGDGGGTGPGDGDGECKDPGGCDGTGPGPGPGPGTGEGGDGGAPGPTTGRLYKKSGKTVQKVLAEFKTAIEGAPILSKVKGFFGSCTGGGSCPTATWDGGQYAGKFDLGALCSGPLLQLFQYAGFVFLAGMGVVALRWALL